MPFSLYKERRGERYIYGKRAGESRREEQACHRAWSGASVSVIPHMRSLHPLHLRGGGVPRQAGAGKGRQRRRAELQLPGNASPIDDTRCAAAAAAWRREAKSCRERGLA